MKFLASTLTIVILLYLPVIDAGEPQLDVPYVGTPYVVVNQMLNMADVGPDDYLIDLGSGDGRIVTTAAIRGARAHGVEIDPKRIEEAYTNAREDHVSRRVMFLEEDIFETDFSRATVVTMYLLPTINVKLREKLIDNLEPGAKIVSHNFDMDQWKADERKTVKVRGRMHNVYLWIVPADVEGSWQSRIGAKRFDIDIDQEFQEIDVQFGAHRDDRLWNVDDVVLQGKRIAFTATEGNLRYIFSGKIVDDTIEGLVQIYQGDDHRIVPWQAYRQ